MVAPDEKGMWGMKWRDRGRGNGGGGRKNGGRGTRVEKGG